MSTASMRTAQILDAATLWDLLEARAASSPDEVILVDERDRTVTFAQFRERALRVAAALAESGIRAGDVVAWQLPTRISTFLVLAALRRLGAVQAPLIPNYREREVAAVLETTGAAYLLVPGTWNGVDFGEIAAKATAGHATAPTVLVIGDDAPESDAVDALPAPSGDAADVRWIFFTSGSTGAPKGARHSDAGLLAAGTAFARRSGLGAHEREFGGLAFPMAHIGGVCALIAQLAIGFGGVLVEVFAPGPVAELFRRNRVTFIGGSPVFYALFLQMSKAVPGGKLLPDLRLFKGGGAPCSAELYRAVTNGMGVAVAHDYGMTEAPMISVGSPVEDSDEQLAHTEGRPIPGLRVRIVGADGAELPAGESGEVHIIGTGLCHGYTDPAETAAAFDSDGWFRTGDIGRLRTDGHLEITGRLKDMIIRKGENIAPLEIEELLAARPDVGAAAVFGLPDPVAGERVCAVITAAGVNGAPAAGELVAHLRGQGLMPQKLPEVVHVVEAMPMTATGKIDKLALRARFG